MPVYLYICIPVYLCACILVYLYTGIHVHLYTCILSKGWISLIVPFKHTCKICPTAGGSLGRIGNPKVPDPLKWLLLRTARVFSTARAQVQMLQDESMFES